MAAHGAVRFYSSATLLDEEPAGDTAQSDRTRPTLVTFRQGDFVLVQWERAPGATAPPVTVCRIEAMFEVTGVITVELPASGVWAAWLGVWGKCAFTSAKTGQPLGELSLALLFSSNPFQPVICFS